MNILGASRFDQYVINMSLINICNRASYIGYEMGKLDTEEATTNPWQKMNWFTIYVPHPNQEYDGVTLEEGLTKGYNIEVKPVEDKSQIPYDIPEGGHFVVVLKQKGVDLDFGIAATGIFVRPLAILSLDIIVDIDSAEYQQIVVKHPIIREYPTDWQDKLKLFINKEIPSEDLPNLVGYVDQAFNSDYRSPTWQDIHSFSQGFVGV